MLTAFLWLALSGGPPAPQSQHARGEARADASPDTYETAVYLTGDLASAIVTAAGRFLPKSPKSCFDELQSYRVHASVEGNEIVVVFRLNTRCGEGLLGGGGRVRIDRKTLRVVAVKGSE